MISDELEVSERKWTQHIPAILRIYWDNLRISKLLDENRNPVIPVGSI